MSSSALEPVFKSREVAMAALLAFTVEAGILLLWIYAGAGSAHVTAVPIDGPEEIPIAVKPVMDDLPLLKLGGKKKAKLPDMWKKQAPVQRFEETSAPSAKASKSPAAIPSSKLDAARRFFCTAARCPDGEAGRSAADGRCARRQTHRRR